MIGHLDKDEPESESKAFFGRLCILIPPMAKEDGHTGSCAAWRSGSKKWLKYELKL